MIDALHIANSGLAANQAWIDNISNNVANMQTVAYKRGQINFRSIVTGSESQAAGNGQLATGAGVEYESSTVDFSSGAVRATNSTYDVAIQGNGFFEVALASGETVFTRVGTFHLNKDGQLALPGGQALASDVLIPPDAELVQIQSDGMVKARIAQTGEQVELGMIQLATFAQPQYLEQIGNGMYRQTDRSGSAIYQDAGHEGAGVLLQGHVEVSNVDLVSEMTELVLAQRAYQLNARILQTGDQILETINNIRR